MLPLAPARLGTLALCGVLISGCSGELNSEPAASSGGTAYGGMPSAPAPVATGGSGGVPVVAGGAAGSMSLTAAGAGGTGGGGAGSTVEPAPVHVVHGFLPNADWLTIVIQAYGMAEHEGLPVYARVGQLDRPEWSRCWSSSRVAAGGFSITLPACDEVGIYKRRLAFIDLNQDGVCNEVVYGTNAAVREDATFTLSDSAPPPPAEQAMGTLFTEGDCAVFNEQWPEQ